MAIPRWARIPTAWIRDADRPGLTRFGPAELGSSAAALILYMAMIIRLDDERKREGSSGDHLVASYTSFQDTTGLSRVLISRGIRKLEEEGLISVERSRKPSVYVVTGYPPKSWGKLPKTYLYNGSPGELYVFKRFSLRNRHELNAIKIYMLLIAFRNEALNLARISYDNITRYTGIQRAHIRPALSLLVCHGLIHIDRDSSSLIDENTGAGNQYRVLGIDPYKHPGTRPDLLSEFGLRVGGDGQPLDRLEDLLE